MAAVSTVRIYDTLKSHFGEADARQFIGNLEALTREAHRELVTKADLKAEIAEFRADLEKKIAEPKTDIIRWMFLFWIGQVAAVSGLINFLLPSL